MTQGAIGKGGKKLTDRTPISTAAKVPEQKLRVDVIHLRRYTHIILGILPIPAESQRPTH